MNLGDSGVPSESCDFGKFIISLDWNHHNHPIYQIHNIYRICQIRQLASTFLNFPQRKIIFNAEFTQSTEMKRPLMKMKPRLSLFILDSISTEQISTC